MKKAAIYLLLVFLFQSCWRNNVDDEVLQPAPSAYIPITQKRVEFEKTIVLKEAQPIVTSGKIYVKDDFIFLNELAKGFHIINNTDPENPEPIGYVEVLLATDLAIRDRIFYVHHAVDLVSFTFSETKNQLIILHRERNVFPELFSPDGFPADYYDVPEDEIIIGYQLQN